MSDLVIILNQRRAIEAFTKGGNLTLGGNLTVAVGPVGRSARQCFRGFYWPNYNHSLIIQNPARCNASKPAEHLLATSLGISYVPQISFEERGWEGVHGVELVLVEPFSEGAANWRTWRRWQIKLWFWFIFVWILTPPHLLLQTKTSKWLWLLRNRKTYRITSPVQCIFLKPDWRRFGIQIEP